MRLIDADELTEMVWREQLDTRERIANLIARQPTIERSVKQCKMIPYNPDRRGCADLFYCTNCQTNIDLGFISQRYCGKYCIECGAEVEDGENNVQQI